MPNELKLTPGPWRRYGNVIQAGGDRHAGIDPYTVASRVNNSVNGDLIAAEPDLADAVRMCHAVLKADTAERGDKCNHYQLMAMRAAAAAIAKAEGR